MGQLIVLKTAQSARNGPMNALDKTTGFDPDAARIGRIDLAREAPIRLGVLGVEPALRRVANDDGREAILEPRVMQVLVAVVGEDALNRVVARLRRMLDEVGADVRLETINKVGYRLVVSAQTAVSAPPA